MIGSIHEPEDHQEVEDGAHDPIDIDVEYVLEEPSFGEVEPVREQHGGKEDEEDYAVA